MPSVTYRTATLGDAELAADLMTAAYPALPQDPVILRLRWERPRTGFAYGRFIAERDGGPICYLGWTHAPWEERPDRPHDRIWIALHDDQPVSMSYLKYPPVRGTVWTSYTCTHPAYRGRGLAKGVKLQGLAQAVALGVPSVCTDNDSENAPMLRINQQLGYEPRPGFVEHHKRVTNQGA